MKTLLCTLTLAGAIGAPAASNWTAQEARPTAREGSAGTAPTDAGTDASANVNASEALNEAKSALKRAFSFAARALQEGKDAPAAAHENSELRWSDARRAMERAQARQAEAQERLSAARSLLASAQTPGRRRSEAGAPSDELVERLRRLERELEALSAELHAPEPEALHERFLMRAAPEARAPRMPREPRPPQALREPREPREPRAPRAPAPPGKGEFLYRFERGAPAPTPHGQHTPHLLWSDRDDEADEHDEGCCEKRAAPGSPWPGFGGHDGKRLRFRTRVERGGDDGDDDREHSIDFSFGGEGNIVWRGSGSGSGQCYSLEVEPDDVTVYELRTQEDAPAIYRLRGEDGAKKGVRVAPKLRSGAVDIEYLAPRVVQVEIPELKILDPADFEFAFDPADFEFDIDPEDFEFDVDMEDFEMPEIEIPDMEMIEFEIPDFEFAPGTAPHGVIELMLPPTPAAPLPSAAPSAPGDGRSRVVRDGARSVPLPGVGLAANVRTPVADESELLVELVDLMRDLQADMGDLGRDIRALHAEIDTLGRD